MSLRWRVALLLGGIALIGMLGVSAASYVATARELDSSAEQQLDERIQVVRSQFQQIATGRAGTRGGALRELQRLEVEIQVIQYDGTLISFGSVDLPVGAEIERLMAAESGTVTYNEMIDGRTYLIRAEASPNGVSQVAIDRTNDSAVLRALRNRMVLIGLVATSLAAGVGWLFARRITQPVERLTVAAGRVAETQDLTPVPVEGDAEVGRLAASFNQMLAALRSSKDQQRRLVDDASHELKTPLTSIRTNVELLRTAPDLEERDRRAILDDLNLELVELSDLVGELVDLARDDRVDDEPVAEVRLDEVVLAAVDRVQRRSGRVVEVDVAPAVVRARPAGLERAVSNLLANAVKFSPAGTGVDVVQSGGRLTVRDRGPGIADADKPLVFDRFYRAEATRSAPGSGLGLSIVAQVVADAGGATIVRDAPGGGAIVGFDLPTVPG